MPDDVCPAECPYLNLTEKRQHELKNITGMFSHHFCMKFNEILKHFPNKEPDITRCEECINYAHKRD